MGSKLLFTAADAEDSGLLPNFCDVRIIFMVILLVEILAIVFAMVIPSSVDAFWDNLAFISMLMQWIALINVAVLCTSRGWLNKLSDNHEIAVSFSLMMLVSLLFSWLMLVLKDWLGLDEETSPLGEHFLFRICIISAAIYALVLRYFYIHRQWKLNLLAQSRAEYQALRARIRPHFLFNSMNTIASLISFKPEQAEKAVEDLSDLFRASLQDKPINTLADELAMTRSYLDIETLRLGDRLQLDWNIDESLKDRSIPSLCLQPLLENAIYHGIELKAEGGVIHISVQREDDYMVIEVSNPITDKKLTHRKEGNQMAQGNIEQRLKLAYGQRASFDVNQTQDSYTVRLKIPLGRVI